MIIEKPWGSYQVIYESDSCKIKIIKIHPHSRTSLQSHKYRDEKMIILQGVLEIDLGEDLSFTITNKRDMIIYREWKHRLCNETDKEIEILEIQTGDKFDEDDIIRYEDDYGRV